MWSVFFFQAEDGIRDLVRSRGLGDVYRRQRLDCGIEYRGEGLPGMGLKVLHRLVKLGRERVWLTGEQKAESLEENEHKCALCSSRGRFEWDHSAWHSESYGEQRC